MKKCKFDIEAFLGIPFDYENWYESMIVELTVNSLTVIVKLCVDGRQLMSGKTGTTKMVMTTS